MVELVAIAGVAGALGVGAGWLYARRLFTHTQTAEADRSDPERIVERLVDESLRHEAQQLRVELESARHRANVARSAKSRFLANMSHELRTPLNAILGYAEMLDEELEGEAQRDISKIRRAAGRLSNLIDDLLDLSDLEEGGLSVRPERLDLVEVVDQAVERAQALFVARGNAVLMDVPTTLMAVADGKRLGQVMDALLSNACKFTEGGQVAIHLRSEGVGVLEEAVLEVEDSGIGMTITEQDRVFGTFVQGDASAGRRYEGTGVGLALVHALIDELGGTVELRSERNVGTVVRVQLPRWSTLGGATDGRSAGV